MTITFHALSIVCALGAVVFAAAAARHTRALVVLVAAFGAAVLAIWPERLPDASLVAALAAAAAIVLLWTGRFVALAGIMGGLLAGTWAGLLEAQGLPLPVTAAASLAAIGVTVWFARTRPTFAPDGLRDEGLLAVAVIGVAVAVLPGVLEGWQTAINLNASTARRVDLAIPLWTLALVAASLAMGALSALWSRR